LRKAFGRCCGVEVPLGEWGLGVPGAVEATEEPFIPLLDSKFLASFVENILVRRFVIEGFSVAVIAFSGFWGSEGGAVPLRDSELVAKPFCVGSMSGVPIDDALEAGCERGLSLLSVLRGSRGALTVAMVWGKRVVCPEGLCGMSSV